MGSFRKRKHDLGFGYGSKMRTQVITKCMIIFIQGPLVIVESIRREHVFVILGDEFRGIDKA